MATKDALFLLVFSGLGLLSCGQPLPTPVVANSSVAVGQGVGLDCSVMGFSQELSITIEKDTPPGTIVTATGTTATLSIEAVGLVDAGRYRCTVSTTVGEVMSQTAFFYLVVRDELAIVTPPTDVAVPPGADAQFSCIFNRNSVLLWFWNGELLVQSSKYVFSDIERRRLTVVGVAYTDMGRYTCQALDGGMRMQYSANLSLIPAYRPLQNEARFGQSVIVTADQIRIRCRVTGVPGPRVIYWQKIGAGTGSNVTGRSGSDPFVDAQGQLDFSEAGVEDGGYYRCVAVDDLGVSAGHLFFVEVTHVSNIFLWTEWYMILVYCVVGLVLVALMAMAVWFCCSVRHNWCVTAKKSVQERVKVRKSERQLFYKTPTPRDEGIDEYAVDIDGRYFDQDNQQLDQDSQQYEKDSEHYDEDSQDEDSSQ